MRTKTLFFITLISFFIITGCSKSPNEFNKPAAYWYQEMLKQIKISNLETADKNFSSLQSEHINSPLIPDAMLILGKAHQDAKEFLLADYYFDEYIKRYGTQNSLGYLTYLKIQTHYLAFINHSKDQEFLSNVASEAQNFFDRHPNSDYKDLVQTMLVRLTLAENELNKAIANVYSKQDKDYAKKRHLKRINTKLEEESKPKPSHVPWYVAIFNAF